MLISLMMNLNMFGGNIPPPPPIPIGGGGGGFGVELMKDERLEAMEKRRKNSNDLAIILASWIINKNR